MTDEPTRPLLRITPEELPPGGAPKTIHEDGSGAHRGLAWAALVMGILSIVFAGIAVGPVAILLGGIVVWRIQARGEGETRHALLAASGMMLGLVGTLLWTGLIISWAGRHGSTESAARTGGVPIGTGSLDRAAIERAAPPIRQALEASASILVERSTNAGWIPEVTGSGTFVLRGEDRLYVLTCAHVVDLARTHPSDHRLHVLWIRGEMEDARLDWTGPSWLDLALVSTRAPAEGESPTLATLAFTESVGIGTPVFAIGDPHEYRASYVMGVVSAVRAITEGHEPLRVLQLQLPLNPGNSGGGLYDTAGALIGINSWRLRPEVGEGLGFSIAVDNLRTVAKGTPLIEKLLATGTPADNADGPSTGSH